MLPLKTQIVLFSATFNDRVRAFAERFAPHANQLMLRQEELSVEGIKQFYMDCADEEAKYDVLVELYNYLTIGQSIIFCKVRRRLQTEGDWSLALTPSPSFTFSPPLCRCARRPTVSRPG